MEKKAEEMNKKEKTDRNTKTNKNRTNANISAGTYYQKNDNFDYDRYLTAKKEERTAHDDSIASRDMEDQDRKKEAT